MRVAVCGALLAVLASITQRADAASLLRLPCVSNAGCAVSLVHKTQATTTTQTTTTVTTRTVTVSVSKLLGSMKQAAAIAILHSQKTMANGKRTKSSLLFVNATDGFRLKIIALEAAIGGKNSAAIAKANRDAYAAYGTLVSTFRLLGVTDKTLTEAVRSITSSWASYASYFVLAQPKTLPANAINIAAASDTIDKVYSQLTVIETRTSSNQRIGRQVAYMKRRIDRHKQHGITAATYRYAMSDLSLVRGSYLALVAVSDTYFTDLVSTLNALQDSFTGYDSYWDAYYAGFYDAGLLQMMSGDITVPENFALSTGDIDASEITAAADDQTVANAVKDVSDAPNDDAAPILTPDDGGGAFDEALPSESQFDCVAEGCGDTQAVNPAADTSQVEAPPPDGGTANPAPATAGSPPANDNAPAEPKAVQPQDSGTSGKDAAPAPSENAPSVETPPAADQNAAPPVDSGAAPNDAAPAPAEPAPAEPPQDNSPPADNSAGPPPSDSAPAEASPPPADAPAQPDAMPPESPPPDSGGSNDSGGN